MTTVADWITSPCPEPSAEHRTRAEQRQSQLTKPAGSLGRLEQLAIELAALQRTERPRAEKTRIIVFAADHGVVAQGMSPFPAEVTVQMLANFAAGGAAISVLAHALGQTLTVIDVGSLAETAAPGILVDKQRRGTRDFGQEPALTADEVAQASGRWTSRRDPRGGRRSGPHGVRRDGHRQHHVGGRNRLRADRPEPP